MTDDAPLLFVDTNILVYATVAQAPFHQAAQEALKHQSQTDASLWISRQVLREYLAVLSRPQTFAKPASMQALAVQIREFEQRFQIAEDTTQVTANLLTLIQQLPVGGKQVHDANIVATMLTYGIDRLLTHNTQDFERFSQKITVLPLIDN